MPTHYHCQILMDMNSLWMPRFEWKNQEKVHMHTYILKEYIHWSNIYELNLN